MIYAIIISAVLIAAGAVVLIAVMNKAVTLTEISVESEKIPESFSGLRIAQISDLHNCLFGEENEKLLNVLSEAEPDIIVMTGDIIDSYKTDVDVSIAFVREAVKIAPCLYVMGNHENRVPEDYKKLRAAMTEAGVEVLENKSYTLEKEGESITFIGLCDFVYDSPHLLPTLKELSEEAEGYRIVLSHKPDFFDDYVRGGADLVFCGHAHGGQIRIPWIGGVIAPGQGLFPEYYEGIHQKEDTFMIVSRGLGNSLSLFRINNRPEVVLAVLGHEKTEDQ